MHCSDPVPNSGPKLGRNRNKARLAKRPFSAESGRHSGRSTRSAYGPRQSTQPAQASSGISNPRSDAPATVASHHPVRDCRNSKPEASTEAARFTWHSSAPLRAPTETGWASGAEPGINSAISSKSRSLLRPRPAGQRRHIPVFRRHP